jgi:hypothetical protein
MDRQCAATKGGSETALTVVGVRVGVDGKL